MGPLYYLMPVDSGKLCDFCRTYQARVRLRVQTAKHDTFICAACLPAIRAALKAAFKELLAETAHSKSERRRLDHSLEEKGRGQQGNETAGGSAGEGE